MLSILFGDKVWAQELGYGHPGDVEMAHLWSSTGGGLHYLKFRLALPPNYLHPLLRKGTKVEVFRGTVSLGRATLQEMDPVNWDFTADGVFKQAENVFPVQTVLVIDMVPYYFYQVHARVTEFISAGTLDWSSAGNMPQRINADGPETGRSLANILNGASPVKLSRWGVDPATNAGYFLQDPLNSTWALTPGIALMPVNDETPVSILTMTYNGGTVTAGSNFKGGEPEYVDHGTQALTAPEAQAIANDYYARNGSRVTFTQGLDIREGDLTNPGSVALDRWSAGLLVCGNRGLHHGIYDKFTGGLGKTVTWVCGFTIFKDGPGGGSLQMTSVDLAPRAVSGAAFRLSQGNVR